MSYPNLELVEYKFIEVLRKSNTFELRREKLREKWLPPIEFDVEVFSQVWGSTCTAFDIDSEGRACIGGCAMTKAYTVVIREESTEIYGVFVGSRFAYLVVNPSDLFFEDLKNCNMATVSEAGKKY